MTKNMRIKQTSADNIFDAVNNFFLVLILIISAYPVYFVIIASISNPNAVWTGRVVLLPYDISFISYENVLKHNEVWTGYANSLYYTAAGTLWNLLLTFMAAYPLARKEFMIRGFLMKVYVFTMYFNGGIVPTFFLMQNLNLINSRWVMIIPGAVGVWNLIVTRTYLQSTIPVELYEASWIDGCSNAKMLWKIVLPLSGPIIAVQALFYGVGHWNAWFGALIYLKDRSLYPLQLILREILIQSQMSFDMLGLDPASQVEYLRLAESLKYSLIVVASLPVLLIYAFVQKYFVKGVMLGSLKG